MLMDMGKFGPFLNACKVVSWAKTTGFFGGPHSAITTINTKSSHFPYHTDSLPTQLATAQPYKTISHTFHLS